MATSPQLFVSHSHEDDAFCHRLVADLRAGLGDDEAVWYDTSGGLHGGDAWWDRIIAEITERTYFLVVLSPAAAASRWVPQEMTIAFRQHVELGKRLLPVRLAAAPRRADWSGLQEFDFQGHTDPVRYATALAELGQALGIRLSAEPIIHGVVSNELIGDRYELGEAIGRGSMATIHKAMDVRMGREVAVKILREVYSSDPKFVTRFQREARAASALQHPNIVQVFDYGQSGDAYYIVMELINGADLRKYLKREGLLTPERAVEIAHDVALGLGAAHRRTIVHRDVKPQNVLIDEDGLVKLTDFGIATMYKDIDTERLTTPGIVFGAVAYIAPEQAQGEIVTPAADIYALGIVMYEMLTSKTPFDGDTPVAVAMRHIQDLPEPPSRLNPEIPRELERIILRCLEKDPRDRYPNGDALAYALDQYARGPQRRFGSSSTGIRPQIGPLGLPGMDGRSQPNRNSNANSQFGASAVISGPRRGTPPPEVTPGSEFYDAPTYESAFNDVDNSVSTNPWSTARGTVPRISGSSNGEYGEGRRSNIGLLVALVGLPAIVILAVAAGIFLLAAR